MKTKVTIKKYPGGTDAVSSTKKVVSKKSKPIDTYTRETTTTSETKAGSKGKLYIKEGTVQRKSTGGVDFIPKEKESSISKNGKIVDPKSNKAESAKQSTLRKMALKSHEGVDLSKRYKEGDHITYDTKKGTQVAGKVHKTPDTPAEHETVKTREIQVSKKGDVQDSGGNPKVGKDLKSKGYINQAGTYKYIKPDEHKFVAEHEVAAHEKQGYFRSDRAKNKLDKKAKGVKKIMSLKKGC